jgi:hypothetical protein
LNRHIDYIAIKSIFSIFRALILTGVHLIAYYVVKNEGNTGRGKTGDGKMETYN